MRVRSLPTVAAVLLTPVFAHGQVGRSLDTLCGPTADQVCSYDRSGAWVQTLTTLQKSRDLEPESPQYYLALGITVLSPSNPDVAESKRASARKEFEEGRRHFPGDPRFHLALGALSLTEGKPDAALVEFRVAHDLDPSLNLDDFVLAALNLGDDAEAVLKFWSAGDTSRGPTAALLMPPVGWRGSLLPPFSEPPGLERGRWRTVEARVKASNSYKWVKLSARPTPAGNTHNVEAVAPPKETSWAALVFLSGGLVPVYKTASLNLSNIGRTGINWKSRYRNQPNRRRGDGTLQMTLPSLFWGTAFTEFGGTWRAEHWDIGSIASDANPPASRFDYESTSWTADVRFIPHYRIDLHGGVTYVNREARGTIAPLALDGRNTGKFRVGTRLMLLDRRVKTDVSLDGFVARKSVLSDFDFTGGTGTLNNTIPLGGAVLLNVAVSAGTSWGHLPLDEYFMLGFPSSYASAALRAHKVESRGRYGRGPMGTEYTVGNVSLTREVWRTPGILLRGFYIPSVELKMLGFFDMGKASDQFHVFKNTGWVKDVGVGVDAGLFRLWVGRDLRGRRWSFGNEVLLWK